MLVFAAYVCGLLYAGGVQLRYQYRVEPTPAQRLMLARTFGSCRTVFNDALARRKADYEAGRPTLSRSELQTEVITVAKKTPERQWLSEVSSVALVQAHNDLLLAFNNFFQSVKGTRKGRKVGYPRFRSRHDNHQSARFTREGFRLRQNSLLYLAKIGDLRVRWSRPLPSEPSSVTIIKDAAGRYFVSFVVLTDEAADATALPSSNAEVGIDLGLKAFAVLSDGSVVESPRFLRRAERKLRRAQQCLSRKKKGSNNRRKQIIKVARIHARIRDSRDNFHHQLSTRLIRENQTIIVEDLAVAGMLGSRRRSKSISDAGWATFSGLLAYKAARYGREFIKVGRFEPTTRRCSACGELSGPKGQAQLGIREWTCRVCAARHDRDHNAAINILAAGRAERLNASGGQVSPVRVRTILAQPDERGTHQSDRDSAKPALLGAVGIPVL